MAALLPALDLTGLGLKIAGLAIAAVVVFGGGTYAGYRWELGTVESLKAAEAAAVALAETKARSDQHNVDLLASKAGAAEGSAQTRIVTQTVTITKEIPRYVKDTSDCITFGLVRVLHAAATGADPASDDYTAGEPDGACAPVSWTSLAADYSDDLATGRENAEQLNALIAFEQAAQPSVKP